MTIILPVILLLLFVGILACLYTEGMWGNAIMLINVVTAALLATNFFEPAARLVEGFGGFFKSMTYCWDYLMLWIIFAASLLVFRIITDKLCRVKVRFLKLADQIGGIIFACLVGWVFISFTLFSLHTAPLSKNFLFGGFDEGKNMMFGFAPDKFWIRCARSVSKGSYRKLEKQEFDPYGQFTKDYETRRLEIERHVGMKQSLLKD